MLNTDKHSSYANAIARLKKEGRLRGDVEQRRFQNTKASLVNHPEIRIITDVEQGAI
jgi:hypothetical protein